MGFPENKLPTLTNKLAFALTPTARLMPQEGNLFESYCFLQSRRNADRLVQRVQNLEMELCLKEINEFLKSHTRKPRCAPETSQVGYENKAQALRNTAFPRK